MYGKRNKGKRHHERHGKNYRVHFAIIAHIGQLQQFCYNYVTLLWLILADTAGNVPGEPCRKSNRKHLDTAENPVALFWQERRIYPAE